MAINSAILALGAFALGAAAGYSAHKFTAPAATTTAAAHTTGTPARRSYPTLPEQATGEYTLDGAHSEVGFVIKHAMVSKVRGSFGEATATFSVNSDRTGRVEATIATASINTNNDARDQHVRGDDFFAVEKFPEARFQGTFTVPGAATVEEIAGTTFPVEGELTLKGVTRPVTLDVEVSGLTTGMEGETRLGFTVRGTINRVAYGIDFNAPMDAGGVLLGEDVALIIEGAATKNA